MKPTLASLQAELEALRARVEALESKPAAPRPGRWQPSQALQSAKAEYLRRKAAGENVIVRGGKCVAI